MSSFFHQKVNSYLCIALIGLMGFWTVLYYFVHRVEAFGAGIAEHQAALRDAVNK